MNDNFQDNNQEYLDTNFTNSSTEIRIEALKSLAMLLLREVEAFQSFSTIQKKQKLPGQIDLSVEVERYEADLIRAALIKTNGVQRLAAKLLGTKVTTLNTKIRRHGIKSKKTDHHKTESSE